MHKRHAALALTIALLELAALSGCATMQPSSTRQPTMLPPELHEHEAYLAGLGEPPFWSEGAGAKHSSRIRLLIAPPLESRARVAIRIDTDASGRAVGYVVRGESKAEGWTITQRRRFRVGREDLRRLDALISRSQLWQIHPQYWVLRDEDPMSEEVDVCIDGVEVIMERVTLEGYRFSEANAQCTAPREYLEVAAQIVDMAGLAQSDIARWLR